MDSSASDEMLFRLMGMLPACVPYDAFVILEPAKYKPRLQFWHLWPRMKVAYLAHLLVGGASSGEARLVAGSNAVGWAVSGMYLKSSES